MIEFDGINKIIFVDKTEVKVEEIYSRWKDWVLKDLNAMFFQAFIQDEVNGEIMYYLINDWKIEQKNFDNPLIITGNLIIGEK